MTGSSVVLLLLYCVIIGGVSLLGGHLAQRLHMTHTRIQLVMSLVAGLMLGVACYHLLPHSIASFDGVDALDSAVWWLVMGLVVMLLLLRLFHFHQHDFTGVEHDCQDHAHLESGHPESEHAPGVSTASWLGIALGLSVHTVIDGLALGAAVAGGQSEEGYLLGLGVFVAIALHKPLDALSISALMGASQWSRSARRRANTLFALMCPAGAALFVLGVDVSGDAHSYWVGAVLAFSAGSFICIALSDLLPEVHFHSHDKGKLTIAFVLGLVLAYSIVLLEPEQAHSHGSQKQYLLEHGHEL